MEERQKQDDAQRLAWQEQLQEDRKAAAQVLKEAQAQAKAVVEQAKAAADAQAKAAAAAVRAAAEQAKALAAQQAQAFAGQHAKGQTGSEDGDNASVPVPLTSAMVWHGSCTNDIVSFVIISMGYICL